VSCPHFSRELRQAHLLPPRIQRVPLRQSVGIGQQACLPGGHQQAGLLLDRLSKHASVLAHPTRMAQHQTGVDGKDHDEAAPTASTKPSHMCLTV